MHNLRFRPLLMFVAVAVAAAALHASSPRFFRVSSQADFLKGDVQNLSIDDRGQLTLGPATQLVYEAAAPFLWSVVPGADGSLFVGTGNEGRVYRVDAKGVGSLFFDSVELEVHALAPSNDGGLFVGTSPDGKIYKVDRTGAARTFFEPGERYIWALATDKSGTLYAATGEKGVIYRITPDGNGSRFYQAGAMHVTRLAFDSAGNLIIGTGSPGRVLRVDPKGQAFVLLDTPYREISALRFDAANQLYVAATNGSGVSAAPPSAPGDDGVQVTQGTGTGTVAVVTTEVTSMSVGDAGAQQAPSTSGNDSRLPRGAIYRIAPDGLWDDVWESPADAPYDLIFDANGRVVVATGSQGKIFRLEGTPAQATLLARAEARQVTALHRDASGRIYYATANPGRLQRLTSERASEGTYESEVLDAQAVSTWGLLSWKGSAPPGSKIEVFTRSGNTQAEDETWSPWSAPHVNAAGSPITSPKARYLQWRVVLTGKGDGPVLTSITAAYLQKNLPPQVRSLTVHPPGIVFQKPFAPGEPDLAGFENQTTPDRRSIVNAANQQSGSPALGRRDYQRGLQTLIWRAEDANEDEIEYDVLYRREGVSTWSVLRQGLVEPIFVWDTATVPNGTYFVKIVATDAPSNPSDLALTGELVSVPFDVDNTPPRISTPTVRVDGTTTVVTFEVTDEDSRIQMVEYTRDGQEWRAAFPVDGLADSGTERFELRLPGTLGPRGISLRATDAMNNSVNAEAGLAR